MMSIKDISIFLMSRIIIKEIMIDLKISQRRFCYNKDISVEFMDQWKERYRHIQNGYRRNIGGLQHFSTGDKYCKEDLDTLRNFPMIKNSVVVTVCLLTLRPGLLVYRECAIKNVLSYLSRMCLWRQTKCASSGDRYILWYGSLINTSTGVACLLGVR